MQFDPPIWRFVAQACPCCGQGSLAFYACPGCGRALLVCEEVGTVYPDSRNLAQPAPRYVDDPQCLCPGCGRVPLARFRPASAAEVVALGFTPGEYE